MTDLDSLDPSFVSEMTSYMEIKDYHTQKLYCHTFRFKWKYLYNAIHLQWYIFEPKFIAIILMNFLGFFEIHINYQKNFKKIVLVN